MNNKIILISLLSAVLLISSGTPQREAESKIVPERIILQISQAFKAKHTLSELQKSYSYAGLQPQKCLSAEMGIWLFSFSEEKTEGHHLLERLRKEGSITHAQFEHYLSLREVIPNDPRFGEQWALKNTGQSGGVADADIDATEAWEIEVNTGTTILGDTIVLVIVDDGFYLDHEDMNYWKNRYEIPDNGIDDDNNGYIDDYDGWNAYASNGTIPVRSHGTQVAGIAGAIGNNGTGVCGVNWNCALMPVGGSSTFEATVVEAFAYVYKMRSLYEETNGAKGAYIIATNGSFGVDYGNPDDYPIWGMMYDSLGSLGILNSAATMNHPSNVEVAGDVPTNFDSDFLIGVTNTTNKDLKYSSAAWGPVSIDLGAPGTNIITTKASSTYGSATGTSMASPQLSGSIALMFAAADETFLQKYNEHPAIMAVFMKNLILDVVDTLSGFDTLCVSGGRLNVNSAIEKMLKPRIFTPADTFTYFIAPDSSGQSKLVLQNLVGFDLPFTCNIESMPAWIGFTPVSDILPGGGSGDILINFNAIGLSLGNYYCKMVIEDIAGKQISVIIEMKIIPNMGLDNGSHEKSNIISYYPNPFISDLNIAVETSESGELLFLVYSLSGKLLQSWDETFDVPGIHTVKWNGSDKSSKLVPPGIYIIRLIGDSFSEQIKVIKF